MIIAQSVALARQNLRQHYGRTAADRPRRDVAKPNRTNRTRQTDATDAPTDSPVTDDAVAEETAADAVESDATDVTAEDGVNKDSTAKDSGSKKPAGRNRKAADSASSTTKGSTKKSSKRDAKSGNPAKRASTRTTASYTSTPGAQTIKPNGRWFVPTMVTILLLGLAWLVTFYLSSGTYPVEAWGYWNLGVGFAILVAGLVMSTRWR